MYQKKRKLRRRRFPDLGCPRFCFFFSFIFWGVLFRKVFKSFGGEYFLSYFFLSVFVARGGGGCGLFRIWVCPSVLCFFLFFSFDFVLEAFLIHLGEFFFSFLFFFPSVFVGGYGKWVTFKVWVSVGTCGGFSG